MEQILAAAAIMSFIIAAVAVWKMMDQERKLIKLQEQMNRFLIYYKDPLEENLDEGKLANFYNELAKMEQQLLLEHRKEDSREQEFSNFVENIAHQMMNAVTALQIQIDLLQLSAENSRQGKNLEKAQFCIERMKTEIDRILKSSQLASGKIHMIYEPLNLENEVKNCMKKIAPLAEQKGVDLKLDCKETCTLSGDPFWLSQAVENIIKNAVEHTAQNSRVFITIIDEKRTAVIRIEDEGEGIPVEQQTELFVRFSRGTGEKAGYGIGLSMAFDIVKAHHGTITAGNREQGGAWFEISIPVMEGAGAYEV